MESGKPREFAAKLTDLQEGFKYRVQTPVADSTWYTVTVNPRPSITGLDVKYVYPSYTGMESATVAGGDGTIEAIVGTRVTLTVHSVSPLMEKDGKKNQLLIDEGKPTRDRGGAVAGGGEHDGLRGVVCREPRRGISDSALQPVWVDEQG